MSKPTIVIIPGAWQKPIAYEGLAKDFRNVGYQSVVVPLPTVGGTDLPLAGLADDVAAVQAALKKEAEKGQKAILLCHSAGGLIGSNAVAGADNVAGIIFMSAFMIPKGKAILDMLGGNPLPWMKIEGDRVTGVAEMLPQVAFNDLSAEAQEKWGKEMTHTSIQLFGTPSSYEPWANGVPCAYIFLSDDNALPYPVQQQMAAQLGPEPISVTLKSSHCAYLSIPDQVVSAVQDIESRLK
ncbi:Alpha/Beta hydrolase protein [Pseudomassariella vexata]|uniref:Alpha/Beta hydrolase protein n=1 Tax=Pseudomassariella vexata TaxID=1141098 RepID=A0A1Y2DFZ5_9PEZI|nr:Alpha/Beta hydrolase protein [Pseudomassariella vexata]ORY58149.1 Alpha/Beta hydrolase protein [Pseudomassariella vexata]